MTRTRILFEIPDGGRVAAQPREAKRSVDGKMYVWVRRDDGEITRAFATSEQA